MINTVAIIGRPNVGKSTLFNALLEKRRALTSSNPGMTRDRTYAAFNPSKNKKCLLVDTGGMVPGSKEYMPGKINMQVEIALSQADIILFLVDAKSGLLPLDEEIAQKLRRTNKPVQLVVNKADIPEHEVSKAEFYALGFNEITAVSAVHKRNISSCVEFISQHTPAAEAKEEKDSRRILSIAGKPNVGKSTLVNKIFGEERVIVDECPGTTRNPASCPVKIKGKDWEIVDLAGMWRKKRGKEVEDLISMTASRREIENSDICILMLDITKPISFQDKRIANWIVESGAGVIAAGNKLDLGAGINNIEEVYEEGFSLEFPYLYFAPFILVSAKTGEGIEELLGMINRVYENAHKRISDEDLDLLLRRAIKKKPPPEAANERPIILSLTQRGVNPPCFTLLVKHRRLDKIQESWKNYIRNLIYREFGYYGVPIKIKMKKHRSRNI
ncbi:MAG: ribosome biogenesis GTPase Der [Elusimicrobiota bacterium]